jgi:hypothetical protein
MVLASKPAHAEAGLDLEWSAPAACPDREAIAAEVHRLVGAFEPLRPVLRARGVIVEQDEGGWLLTLETELDGLRGERRLEGRSCRSVADAGALLLALALNPDLEEAITEAPSVGTPAPAKPARPASGPAVPSPPRRRPASEVRAGPSHPARPRSWRLREGFGVQSGSLPRPALEVGGALGLGVDRFALHGAASAAPTRQTTVTTADGAGAELRLWSLSGEVERWWLGPPVDVAPVVGVQLTEITGTGVAVSSPRTDSMYWTSAVLGPALALRLTPAWWLRVDARLLLPVARPTARIEGAGPVHQPDATTVRLGVGLEQRIRWRSRSGE